MEKSRKFRLSGKSGETIVEVVVSAMIFLLLMAILQGAITFSSRAQDKSRSLRKNYAEVFQNIASTPITPNETTRTRKYTFRAYNTEETEAGNEVFDITTDLGYKDVPFHASDGSTGTIRFPLFADDETDAR